MLDAGGLIEKHRAKCVFLDTNLLVLLLVGLVNVERARNFKRTQDFTVDDSHSLQSLVRWFGVPLIATPHVLSQVSDLTDLPGRERRSIRELFKATVEMMEEQYDTAKQLVRTPLFDRFGLGDASVRPFVSETYSYLRPIFNFKLPSEASVWMRSISTTYGR